MLNVIFSKPFLKKTKSVWVKKKTENIDFVNWNKAEIK